jgi:uncharacterized protein YbaA (DUF1428 family)
MKIDIWFNDGRCSRCYAPSFDRNLVIAKEDEPVWAEYLTKMIGELLTPDAIETLEFKAAVEKVRKDRERALRFELRKEKEREDYKRRKVMSRPKITFIPKGLTVDYEKEYAVFFDQEVAYSPIDSDDFLYQFRLLNRWLDKSVPQIIEMGRPDAAYAIAIELCRHIPLFLNRDDLQGYIQEYKVRIKKMIVGSFSALVTAVKAWNNEEKRLYVNNFIFEQSKQYGEFKGLQKTLIQMMISEPFVGEPVQVTREMSDDEAYQLRQEQRRREFEERVRLAEEREAKSLIPLNPDYETMIFNRRHVSWEFAIIDIQVGSECDRIRALADKGDYMTAATCFLQLTKSMCKHFIEDEHYNYFDDLYAPEYTIQSLVDYFNRLLTQGKLPEDVKEYLHKGWTEIKTYEACTDYGLFLHCNL